MELRGGYKQTEVGVIPEDWDCVAMGDIGESLIGLTYSPNDVNEYGVLVLRSSNVQGNQLAYDNNVYVNMELPKRVMVKNGDILICVRNGSRKLIGKCALIDETAKGAAFGAFMSIYRSKYSKFVFYQFQANVIHKQIEEVMGATINQITNKDLASFGIPLPPTKTEQTTIANALGDVDAWIQSLTRLIAKKHEIKQGAMQTLLNPYDKGRLKAGWAAKKLGNVGIFRGGSGFPINYQGEIEGVYPFYKVSDMNNEGNNVFMIRSNNWIDKNIQKSICATVFPKYTIAFAKIGAAIFLERKRILSQESCIDNNMMGFIFDENIYDVRYIYYLFLTIKMGKLVSMTALPSLNGKEISELEYFFPPNEQQTLISTILSDMDAEIIALKTKLAKAQQIKQGMMQNLLTGRIRLI